MCGISGGITRNGLDITLKVVKEIVRSQCNRGPDYQDIEVINNTEINVILGHNRLSIIDLTPEANQPMWDHEKKYCLVFNGEIYNYIELKNELKQLGHLFLTQSDSEVILEAFKEWGVQSVKRFNGMFAFAIFDTVNQKLFLYRDRFGVKPLYYYRDEEKFIFASTTNTIGQNLSLEPNLEYLAQGIQYGFYDNEDISPYKGLKALKPAHYLVVDLEESGMVTYNLKEYYNLHNEVEALTSSLSQLSTNSLCEKVADLMDNALDIRYRADVPIGVSLSGGLDSSTVAALSALRGHNDVIGFTFGHSEDRKTEGPLVKELSKKTGIKVRYIWPEVKDIINSFSETLAAQGAPFLSGSVMAQYMVFKDVKASGVKVLLGGQGGDELFMGYRKFFAFHLRQLIIKKNYGEALEFILGLVPLFLAELRTLPEYWKQRHRYTSRTGMDTVLNLPKVSFSYMGFDPNKPLWERQITDIMHTSLPSLLRYEDRNSMGNSVESRLMFLDYRLVELALAIPTALKLKNGYGKWIIRQIVKGKIPESIRSVRYKRGFDIPQNQWIDQGLGELLRREIQDRLSKIKDFLLNTNINEQFSNEQFKQRPLTFAEAATIIWLGDQLK